MQTEKSVSKMITDKLTNNDTTTLLKLDTPSKLRELAEQLSNRDNKFYSILLSSLLASEIDSVYNNSGDFWWKEYAKDDNEIAKNIRSELDKIITAAIQLKNIKNTALEIEKKYRNNENDDIFILIDLKNISAYADLPNVRHSLQIDEYLPNATFYKGRRQIQGFKSGITGYSIASDDKEPRTGCLTRAYKNAAVVLTGNKIISNGLTMQAVEGLANHIVITGKVENKIPIVGQYNDETISPQEYILQIMYGAFANEPVVALKNREPEKDTD